MPNLARALPSDLYNLLSTAANAFVALVTFYILKYIFELPFHCTCTRGIHHYDNMYFYVPPFIIFLLVFIIDKHQYRLFCGYLNQGKEDCYRCRWFWEQLLRLLLTGLFWFAAVFLDGDWYECHKLTNQTTFCKNETLSYETIQLNPHHRNESLVSICRSTLSNGQ